MNKLILILFLLLTSCETPIEVKTLSENRMRSLVGQKIVVVGTAVNAKLGAQVLAKDGSAIWIDEMESWPEGYYFGEDDGKILKVTGTVIEKYDLPVYVPQKGEPEKSGIAVEEGTDLKEASHRFLLKNAKWEVISK